MSDNNAIDGMLADMLAFLRKDKTKRYTSRLCPRCLKPELEDHPDKEGFVRCDNCGWIGPLKNASKLT